MLGKLSESSADDWINIKIEWAKISIRRKLIKGNRELSTKNFLSQIIEKWIYQLPRMKYVRIGGFPYIYLLSEMYMPIPSIFTLESV